jgi:hypothetical protein
VLGSTFLLSSACTFARRRAALRRQWGLLLFEGGSAVARVAPRTVLAVLVPVL